MLNQKCLDDMYLERRHMVKISKIVGFVKTDKITYKKNNKKPDSWFRIQITCWLFYNCNLCFFLFLRVCHWPFRDDETCWTLLFIDSPTQCRRWVRLLSFTPTTRGRKWISQRPLLCSARPVRPVVLLRVLNRLAMRSLRLLLRFSWFWQRVFTAIVKHSSPVYMLHETVNVQSANSRLHS